MKNRLRIALASAALVFGAFASLPAQADSPLFAAYYCYCKFNVDTLDQCHNETTLAGTFIGAVSGDASFPDSVQTQCTLMCNDKHLSTISCPDGGNCGISTSGTSDCDMNPADQCKTARNKVPPTSGGSHCQSCFCKYPADFKTADCRGKTFNLKITSDGGNCDNLCANLAKADGDGVAVDDYNSKCDFVVQGDTCVQNPQQAKNDTCTSQAQASANAKSSAQLQASEGSVIGLPLPLGGRDIPTVIGSVVNRILGTVGAIAFLMFVYGGFSWMLAAGNEERIKHARQIIVWAALGMVVIFAAYGITRAIIQITTPPT